MDPTASEPRTLVNDNGNAGETDPFRKEVVNLLERLLFYVQSAKIYGGVAGLYDFGPPGAAVFLNIIDYWRQVYA